MKILRMAIMITVPIVLFLVAWGAKHLLDLAGQVYKGLLVVANVGVVGSYVLGWLTSERVIRSSRRRPLREDQTPPDSESAIDEYERWTWIRETDALASSFIVVIAFMMLVASVVGVLFASK